MMLDRSEVVRSLVLTRPPLVMVNVLEVTMVSSPVTGLYRLLDHLLLLGVTP